MAVLLAGLMSCSKSATEPKPTVTGTWTGIRGSQLFTLSLVDNSGVVAGSGTLTNTPTGTRALTISGTFIAPTMTITMSSGTLQPISLVATVTGKSMGGTLTGSGFTGEAIELTRP
jgi:hypothetical protein